MKKFCSLIILYCLIVFLFVSPVWADDDWVEFGRTDNGNIFFINKVKIEHQKNGIIRVWEKKNYSNEGRKELIGSFKKNNFPIGKMEKASYCLGLKEIDCEKDMLRILSLTFFDSDNNVLLSNNYSCSNWENIVPTSLYEDLYKKLCRGKKKQ